MKQYTKVVSLGAVCQVAYQIERHFGFRSHSPFDWLITPLHSVAAILTDDGAQFGVETFIQNGATAVCSRYAVSYQHEFARDERSYPNVNPESLLACRNKLQYKYRKLVELCAGEESVLFIRMAGHFRDKLPIPYVEDRDIVIAGDLNGTVAAIETRFPALDFGLVFVYLPHFSSVALDRRELDERVVAHALPFTTEDWQGDDAEWTRIFAQYDVQLRGGGDIAEAELLHA